MQGQVRHLVFRFKTHFLSLLVYCLVHDSSIYLFCPVFALEKCKRLPVASSPIILPFGIAPALFQQRYARHVKDPAIVIGIDWTWGMSTPIKSKAELAENSDL